MPLESKEDRMAKSKSKFDSKKREALRHVAPGQTTFIRYGGVVYPVYRPEHKEGEKGVS